MRAGTGVQDQEEARSGRAVQGSADGDRERAEGHQPRHYGAVEEVPQRIFWWCFYGYRHGYVPITQTRSLHADTPPVLFTISSCRT